MGTMNHVSIGPLRSFVSHSSLFKISQRSNSLMNWSLDTAEQSLAVATAAAKPAILVFNGPIATVDQLLCKGINIVEHRVPALNLPPQLVRLFYQSRMREPLVLTEDALSLNQADVLQHEGIREQEIREACFEASR